MRSAAVYRLTIKWGGPRKRTAPGNWHEPITFNNKADQFEREHGRRFRLFANSWSDTFDNQVPTAWRTDLWDLIRKTPRLDWQLLTKRPQNIRKMLPPDWDDGWPHVWLGTTTENQEEYDRRWPLLARI